MFSQAEKDFIAIANYNLGYIDKLLVKTEELGKAREKFWLSYIKPKRDKGEKPNKDLLKIHAQINKEYFKSYEKFNELMNEWNTEMRVLIDSYKYIKLNDFVYIQLGWSGVNVSIASKILHLSNIENIPKLYQINSHLKKNRCIRVNYYPVDWLLTKIDLIKSKNPEL